MPAFSWDRCTIVSRDAQDLARWPITSVVTRCEVREGPRGEDDTVIVEHSKAGAWEVIDTGPAGWGEIEGSLWAFLPMPDGSWRGATFDMLRSGQTSKDMDPCGYGKSYALGHDPVGCLERGDRVGYLVSTPARGADVRTTNERSCAT
jgi:hypothetical protein